MGFAARWLSFTREYQILDLLTDYLIRHAVLIPKSLFSILSCPPAPKDHNVVKANWLHGQYFCHYSAISVILNYVLVFDLFHMLPDSWHWEKFDPDTLHNGVTKADLGL